MNDLLKILMLEDNEEDADIVLQLLKKTSLRFESTLVMNKTDFLTALDQFKPDLILSDNSLPQFSATEALKIIHQRSIQIPFILVTGTVSDEFAASIIKLGADDYILKDRLVRLPAAIDSALLKKRSAAAMRLKEEEILFKASLLAAVGQAIIATDLDGLVVYWNSAAEKIYGWSAGEAIGKSIIELTASQNTNEQGIDIVLQLKKGESWSGEYFVQRKDGFIFPAFVTLSPIYDQEKKIKGLITVSNDISERKNAEQELKIMEEQILNQKIEEQRKLTRAIITAQEQERNHIGRELHDNISQILTGTKLFLSVAGEKNEAIMEMVKYPIQLIENSIEEIRMLSSKNVTPLRNINLEKLVQVLVDNLNKTSAINTSFVYAVKNLSLSDELKLNIYRLLQEQLNNIIKHAAPKNVSIEIQGADDCINISVTDDGKGFDLDHDRKGIGISNMISRIESFNGKMEIETAVGKGCTINISMPVQS